jgi:hypothetical protein
LPEKSVVRPDGHVTHSLDEKRQYRLLEFIRANPGLPDSEYQKFREYLWQQQVDDELERRVIRSLARKLKVDYDTLKDRWIASHYKHYETPSGEKRVKIEFHLRGIGYKCLDVKNPFALDAKEFRSKKAELAFYRALGVRLGLRPVRESDVKRAPLNIEFTIRRDAIRNLAVLLFTPEDEIRTHLKALRAFGKKMRAVR